MTKTEQGPFAIQLSTGEYYRGMTPGGDLIKTPLIREAQTFPTRWAALIACNQGIAFAGAAIRHMPEEVEKP